MATSSELQRRIEEFVESLESEFGPVAQGKHNCLLSAIEDFGVQVGDEVAKTIAQKKAAKHKHYKDRQCNFVGFRVVGVDSLRRLGDSRH